MKQRLLCLSLLALTPLLLAQDPQRQSEDRRAAVTRHPEMTYTMPVYNGKEEWLARKESLQKQILVAAGLWPMPEKCPLNAHIFDRIERSGYVIEKVYFESYPGFYVTGNLYRPSGKSGPFPAVLSPHGHWAYGRLENSERCSVPARCINMARLGYIVFAYDMVGYNDSCQVDHRLRGDREALWGLGALGLHLWNSIRSVDFLESLSEVDKSRLACTGASGGGTQTFLLTAVDDRISVSAPVNMISADRQGADVCENAPTLRIDTNNMEIGALMAPRPMILVSATGDWTKNTLEVEYPAIRHIYSLFRAEDRITAVRVTAEHNYNKESREHVYRWFGRWLLNLADTAAGAERGYSPEQPSRLLVFHSRPLPEGAKTEQQIIEDFISKADAAVENMKPTDVKSWEHFRNAFGTVLRYCLMAEYPSAADMEASDVIANRRVSRFFLSRSGKGDRVPVTYWLPAEGMPIRQAVLLVHPQGAASFERGGTPDPFVQEILKRGCSVLIPDVFNTGRATFERKEKYNFFTTYNRVDDANRVQDILTCLAYLRAQSGGIPIKVVGYVKGGLWCLLARALAPTDASFAVDASKFDARSDDAYLKELNIPGIRRAGDCRAAAILNLRSRLWIHNASSGFPSEWVTTVFRNLGRAGTVRIDRELASENALISWLLATEL